jgi:hypothetical protein
MIPAAPDFALYVEGPGDRGVLEAWANRLSPALGRRIAAATVIMGGRQPARAAAHFRALQENQGTPRGLCILDRDDDRCGADLELDGVPGLQVYVWPRRHIESYLLVRPAIRRSLRLPPEDDRLERFFRASLPRARDEEALATLDAKALFAARGPLSVLLGRTVRPILVARAMRRHELHRDILHVLQWLRPAAVAELNRKE